MIVILPPMTDHLASLFYQINNPNFQFEFCKGYYARVADGRMNGRVSRLLVTPLLLAMEKVLGPSDYLNFMKSFRYPLAGEFSFRRSLIPELRIPSDWGLEVGILSEMQRNQASSRICQVDIADTYDHKHQSLSVEDRSTGLSRMSADIAKVLIRKPQHKASFGPDKIRTIKATYYRLALDMVGFYQADAELNGLSYDMHSEEKRVELFAETSCGQGKIAAILLWKPRLFPLGHVFFRLSQISATDWLRLLRKIIRNCARQAFSRRLLVF